MANRHPSITWPVFEMCNANQTKAFEDMTRKLFNAHFAGNQELISDGINPGIEVLPVLECEAKEGNQRKRISFQSKYFGKKNSYSDIMDSAKQTVKHYPGKIDKVICFVTMIYGLHVMVINLPKRFFRMLGLNLYQ